MDELSEMQVECIKRFFNAYGPVVTRALGTRRDLPLAAAKPHPAQAFQLSSTATATSTSTAVSGRPFSVLPGSGPPLTLVHGLAISIAMVVGGLFGRKQGEKQAEKRAELVSDEREQAHAAELKSLAHRVRELTLPPLDREEETADDTSSVPVACLGAFETDIVRIGYGGTIITGEPVRLVREPSNRRDRNAVKVHNFEGVQVGYLPLDLVSYLSPMLEDGLVRRAVGVVHGAQNDSPFRVTSVLYGAREHRREVKQRWRQAGRRYVNVTTTLMDSVMKSKILVSFVDDTREAADASLRARLRRRPIEFSEHASCRMDCRFVSKQEVEDTLEFGKVSRQHSMPNGRPRDTCPQWALEHGRLRAVWAECADATRLVTVIDTVTDHPCAPC